MKVLNKGGEGGGGGGGTPNPPDIGHFIHSLVHRPAMQILSGVGVKQRLEERGGRERERKREGKGGGGGGEGGAGKTVATYRQTMGGTRRGHAL
jgi:hypothetical protein